MKWLKTFKKYKESLVINLEFETIDVMESLNIIQDVLLNSIKAEEIDIFDTLKLSNRDIDLDVLSNNVEFINSLTSLALKKSNVENTETYQTFLNTPCKFMFIFGQEQNELENPIYMILQIKEGGVWKDVKLYKVGADVKQFYDKLSSKTIEIVDGDENYIYVTSNGNDWELQNSNKANDIYVNNLRKDELQKLLDERKVKLNII
jgi:hypothetical protein